jgi:hypothetical protein
MNNYFNVPVYGNLLRTSIGIFSFVIIVVYLFSTALLGSWLAIKKGYSSTAWFWLCFFFNFAALLVLVGAPNKNGENYFIEEIYKEIKIIKEIINKEIWNIDLEQNTMKTKSQKEKERVDRLNKYQSIINNPTIEKESIKILKTYGKKAQDKYIQSKMQEGQIINEEENIVKMLNDIGYMIICENGKWKITTNDESGLCYFAYSKEELYEKVVNIINANKNVIEKENSPNIIPPF